MRKKRPSKGWMTLQYFKKHAYQNNEEGKVELSPIPLKKLKKILSKIQ